MSKVLIIPDVHGRPFWRKAKEKINSVDKVVFLGDYLDPYGYEGITRENAIEEFKEIIQFKVDNPDKVILLLGNHDCAYCYDFDVREGDRESTYYQIFGHTQLESEPIITDKFACLDVRRPFILDTETKKIEEYA